MIRYLFCITLFFSSFPAIHAQSYDTTRLSPVAGYGYQWKNGKFDSGLQVPRDADTVSSKRAGLIKHFNGTVWTADGTKWSQYLTTDSLSSFVRIQTQSPTASITADTLIYPYTSASTWGVNLSWSAGRSAATLTSLATNPLSTINVGGVSQSFSQPSSGASVNGVQHVTMPSNINTTYSTVATTTDSKTAQANITLQSQLQVFAGFVSNQTPSDADIQAMLGSSYVGGKYSTSPNQSGNLSTPASSLYPCFVGFGTFMPTVNINNQAVGYIVIHRAFVNIYGYSTVYTISVAPFATAGSIDSYTVTAH